MTSISCIIVSYNNKPYLEKAITSVLEQSKPVDEIIVADDGSTDGSRELITSLARKFSHILPVFRDRNIGVAANRDLAIRQAKGELITTLDGDDWYYPEKVEKELSCFEKQGEVVAFSDVVLVSGDSQQIGYMDMSNFASRDQKASLKWIACWQGPFPRDMLFSKKLYLDAEGLTHGMNLYEDWDFDIRLASMQINWAYSHMKGVAYRRTASGLSSSSPIAHLRCQYDVLNRNRDLLIDNIGISGYCEAVARLFYRIARNKAATMFR